MQAHIVLPFPDLQGSSPAAEHAPDQLPEPIPVCPYSPEHQIRHDAATDTFTCEQCARAYPRRFPRGRHRGATVSLLTWFPTREEAIGRIKRALQARSGKPWSVTGGKGTAYGWLRIDVPPKRRTWHRRAKPGNPHLLPGGLDQWDFVNDPSKSFGHMGPEDKAELAKLLGLSHVHDQGVLIPDSSDFYCEYIQRAEGAPVTYHGTPYWD